MGTSIRLAKLEDAKELARLRWDFRPADQTARGFDEFSRAFERWLVPALSSGRWTAAVADEGDGSLVGCIFLRAVSKVPTPGRIHRVWGYVTNSYVAPDHRGQGLGRTLLDLVIAKARARSYELLIVWPSEEAISLYTRAGFQEVATAHGGPDDYPPLELVFR